MAQCPPTAAPNSESEPERRKRWGAHTHTHHTHKPHITGVHSGVKKGLETRLLEDRKTTTGLETAKQSERC